MNYLDEPNQTDVSLGKLAGIGLSVVLGIGGIVSILDGNNGNRPPSINSMADAVQQAALEARSARAATILAMAPAERAAVPAAERCEAMINYGLAMLSLPDAALAALVADSYRNLPAPKGMESPSPPAALENAAAAAAAANAANAANSSRR